MKNSLRKAAPELLRASKDALSVLNGVTPTLSETHIAIVQKLRNIIDLAEGDNGLAGQIQIVTTPITSDRIEFLVEHGGEVDIKSRLLRELRAAHRTKRRVYITLSADYRMLRWLTIVLGLFNSYGFTPSDPMEDGWPSTSAGATRRAFKRIIKQIEDEVLHKSPLELLANAAL